MEGHLVANRLRDTVDVGFVTPGQDHPVRVDEVRNFVYEFSGITPEAVAETYNRVVARGTVVNGAVDLMSV